MSIEFINWWKEKDFGIEIRIFKNASWLKFKYSFMVQIICFEMWIQFSRRRK